MTEWAPSPPVRSLTLATPSSPRSSTMSVAPKSRASACRSAWRLNTMMRSAPSCFAARMPRSPTAPSPTTATVLPGPASAASAANQPVTSTSEAGIREGMRSGFGHARGGDEGAVGERDAGQFRLGADGPHQHPVHAVGLVPGLADLAAVVGGPEGPDDEVADLDGADLGADLLDDANVLVTHDLVRDRLCAPVGPQVAAADAGRREADDRVCRRDDLGVLAVLDPDVTGSVHDDLTHWMCSCSWCSFAGAVVPAASSEPGADSDRKALPMGAPTGNPSPLGQRLDAAYGRRRGQPP